MPTTDTAVPATVGAARWCHFAKLDLAPTDRTDRRVAAVLRFLEDARRRA